MTEGWLRCRERYRCDRRQDVLLLIRSDTPSPNVSTPQSPAAARRIKVRCRALDLTEVSPGHFDPLDKGGREGSALNRRSTTLRTTQSLLPPLVKGRTVRGTVRCNPGAATINHGGPPKAVEGWLRCRQQYRCDRSVTTAGLSPSTIPLPPARACALRAVLFLQSSLFSLVILS